MDSGLIVSLAVSLGSLLGQIHAQCDPHCKDFYRHCDDIEEGAWAYPGDANELSNRGIPFPDSCIAHFIRIRCPRHCGLCIPCEFVPEDVFDDAVSGFDDSLDGLNNSVAALESESWDPCYETELPCPGNDWMKYDQMCYLKVMDNPQPDYESAKNACFWMAGGLSLAPVLSQEQYDFLIREVLQPSDFGAYPIFFLAPKKNATQWLNPSSFFWSQLMGTIQWSTPNRLPATTGIPPLCMGILSNYLAVEIPCDQTPFIQYICAMPAGVAF